MSKWRKLPEIDHRTEAVLGGPIEEGSFGWKVARCLYQAHCNPRLALFLYFQGECRKTPPSERSIPLEKYEEQFGMASILALEIGDAGFFGQAAYMAEHAKARAADPPRALMLQVLLTYKMGDGNWTLAELHRTVNEGLRDAGFPKVSLELVAHYVKRLKLPMLPNQARKEGLRNPD